MFKSITDKVLKRLVLYLKESERGKAKVLIQKSPEELFKLLRLKELIENETLSLKNINDWLNTYLENTQHMHHPHYMGHQVSVPHPSSAIADLIHGIVNNPMAVYEMGPSAASIEKVMINWMLKKVGWFSADSIYETDDNKIKGGGVLTHGGSLANLTALLAARAKSDPDAWSKGVSKNFIILSPETVHYSISRSVAIMGMGNDAIIPVKVNKKDVMLVDDLYKKIVSAKKENKHILAVAANACATSTGLYDPLKETGECCKEFKLWFHVDGAHGAGALLSNKYKYLLNGLEHADSLIWDAHKMLRTSTLCAAVLFKDHIHLSKTFHQKGSYIYFEKEKVGFDTISNTIECTKAALGTKLFWVLATEGEKKITMYIESRYELAQEVYEFIAAEEDFECYFEPESNIICFLYTKFGKENDFQLKIRNELVKQGDFYITTAIVNKQRYLRLTLMNPYTNIDHIKNLLKEISVIAEYLNRN